MLYGHPETKRKRKKDAVKWVAKDVTAKKDLAIPTFSPINVIANGSCQGIGGISITMQRTKMNS